MSWDEFHVKYSDNDGTSLPGKTRAYYREYRKQQLSNPDLSIFADQQTFHAPLFPKDETEDIEKLIESTIVQQHNMLAVDRAKEVIDFTVPSYAYTSESGEQYPIGIFSSSDWHVQHERCDYKKLKEDMELIGAFPYAFFVGLGDFADNTKSGNEKTGSSLYEAVIASPQRGYKVVEYFLSRIPSKRHICVVAGNHDNRNFTSSGLDSIEDVTEKLGIPYGGPGCIVHVNLGNQKYTIALRHKYKNKNGARALVQQFPVPDHIDAAIIGHHHETEIVQAEFKGQKFTAVKNGTYLTLGSPNYEGQVGDGGQYGVSSLILFPDTKEIISVPSYKRALELLALYRKDYKKLELLKESK
jgi:predicted phosphodiesterase